MDCFSYQFLDCSGFASALSNAFFAFGVVFVLILARRDGMTSASLELFASWRRKNQLN
jgi:hypothetical protein